MTDIEAYDDVMAALSAAWADDSLTEDAPLFFEDTASQRPTSPASVPVWAFAMLRVPDSYEATLPGEDARRRYRNRGFVSVAVYTEPEKGLLLSQQVCEVLQAAFRGKRTAGGVVFSKIRVREVGTSGPWRQANLLANIEYDTIQ